MTRIQRAKEIGLVLAGSALFVFFIFTIIRVSRIPPEPTPFPDAATHATRKDTTAVPDTLDSRASHELGREPRPANLTLPPPGR